MKKSSYSLVKASVIAAMYAALTLLLAPFSFGPLQIRISEILTVIPLFCKEAVPGLTIGCLLANIVGASMGITPVWDLLFGVLATFLSAILTYLIGKTSHKWIHYVFAPLPAVVFNAVIVGLEMAIFYANAGAIFAVWLYSACSVFMGQFVVCYLFGIPFIIFLKRNDLYKKLFHS